MRMRSQLCKSILDGMLALSCLMGGCTSLPWESKLASPATSQPHSTVPPHVADTLAEQVMLGGGPDLLVRGYGVVAGLGTNGSREVPASLREYLSQMLLKNKAMSGPDGSTVLSPSAILEDLDTAVVNLWGSIPAGCRRERGSTCSSPVRLRRRPVAWTGA